MELFLLNWKFHFMMVIKNIDNLCSKYDAVTVKIK